ncbi:hypothetical protein SAMN05444161_8276 [Rhizobiales bacterium GAS191]|jgi:hypothetical protein|nr:hypothetical protein SAMN05444161_8276 [Rhizobiales bacterium GAS191]
MSSRNKPPLLELCAITDIFCSELARLEISGSWARLTFVVRKREVMTGEERREVVAHIVMPREAALMIGQVMPYDPGRLDDEMPEDMPRHMQ